MSDKRQKISKWQNASVKLTQLRIELENTLNSFDEHERKDERYDQVYESVQLIFKHIDAHYNPTKHHSRTKRMALNWKTWIAAAGIGAIAFIADNFAGFLELLKAISSWFVHK